MKKSKSGGQSGQPEPEPELAAASSGTSGAESDLGTVERLVAALGEMGEHDLAAAVEVTGQGLAHAKVVACATFGDSPVERTPDLVFEVYDRINDFFADRDESDR